jgi:hypothetical protein
MVHHDRRSLNSSQVNINTGGQMQSSHTRVYQALRRVAGWGTANAALVPPEIKTQFDTTVSISGDIGQHAAAQDEARRTERASAVTVKGVRTDLRQHHLIPLARIARTVLSATPELRASLLVPPGKANHETLIAAANGMAAIGAAHQQTLVDHGLSVDFVAAIRSQAGALQQAIDTRGQARTQLVASTKAVHADVDAARKVMHLLDVVFSRVLRKDPAALASWKNAKHVTLKGVQPAASAVAPTTAPVAAPIVAPPQPTSTTA